MPSPLHKVTICGIPELPQHAGSGVSHVLSIIDTHEPRPAALDAYPGIDHELIRFDDVVAEYPGFEACTPRHIEQVLAFGERVQARPGSHVLIHCHAGISRSQAAAAILMCQHAPGLEEAAFLKLLVLLQARLAQHAHGRVRRPVAEARRRADARPAGLSPGADRSQAAAQGYHPQHRPRSTAELLCAATSRPGGGRPAAVRCRRSASPHRRDRPADARRCA